MNDEDEDIYTGVYLEDLAALELSGRIRKLGKWMVILTVVLGFMNAGAYYYVYTQSNNNKDALCAYRADLDTRIAQGEKFQEEHPQGAFGFTPAEVAKSLNDQKHVREAFSGVTCE